MQLLNLALLLEQATRPALCGELVDATKTTHHEMQAVLGAIRELCEQMGNAIRPRSRFTMPLREIRSTQGADWDIIEYRNHIPERIRTMDATMNIADTMCAIHRQAKQLIEIALDADNAIAA